MKYLFGLVLMLFLTASVITAQEPVVNEDDGFEHSIVTELITIHVSVVSSKKGCLENLSSKNFEIYDGKNLLTIEFFNFNEQEKGYSIGFFNPEVSGADYDWRKAKVKVKLTASEKKEYGITSVKKQNECYINQK